MSDKKEQTLNEAALNPDGKTYNGIKAMQWMFTALSGKEMTEEEAVEMFRVAKEKAKERKQVK